MLRKTLGVVFVGVLLGGCSSPYTSPGAPSEGTEIGAEGTSETRESPPESAEATSTPTETAAPETGGEEGVVSTDSGGAATPDAAEREETSTVPPEQSGVAAVFPVKLTCYTSAMIRTFKHRGLKRLYERDDKRQVSADHLAAVQDILLFLDVAEQPRDLDRPGWNLHPLKGRLKGFWSVKIFGNWRIIFRFEDADAYDVELIDYH